MKANSKSKTVNNYDLSNLGHDWSSRFGWAASKRLVWLFLGTNFSSIFCSRLIWSIFSALCLNIEFHFPLIYIILAISFGNDFISMADVIGQIKCILLYSINSILKYIDYKKSHSNRKQFESDIWLNAIAIDKRYRLNMSMKCKHSS